MSRRYPLHQGGSLLRGYEVDEDIAVMVDRDALGLRVVWVNPLFSSTERAQIERLLTEILCDGLVAAYAAGNLGGCGRPSGG